MDAHTIYGIDMEDSTANDEAIARAIAESEGHSPQIDATNNNATAARTSTPVANCPGNHGLELFQASNSQAVTCNGCRKRLRGGDQVWSCVQCNLDACEKCYRRGSQAFPTATSPAGNGNGPSRPSPMTNYPGTDRRAGPPSAPIASYPAPSSPSSHMCLVPCTVGSITVEMLVDTGAQSSVLSMPIVNQLGLSNRLDRRYQGVAAGVGRAKINGKISNVIIQMGAGHVEFPMDFIVLDVHDPLVILGLDQMRKYKCLVDIGRNVLVFGGAGGVEVDFLPPNQTHFDVRSLNGGCTLM